MEDDSKRFKPTYIAIAYEYPEVGKSYVCYQLEKSNEGIEYKLTRISTVKSIEQVSLRTYKIHSKKRILYVQVFS